jgi:Holliday junction resolvase RusA-like endonuclease
MGLSGWQRGSGFAERTTVMNVLSINIPGAPIAKKRPRFARRGKFVTTYNPQETEEGKFICLMQSQINGHKPIPAGTPIYLQAQFHMPFPASMSAKKRATAIHTKKPDVDNMLKFLKDCANGVLWHDDSQVVWVLAQKLYSNSPCTVVELAWDEGEK